MLRAMYTVAVQLVTGQGVAPHGKGRFRHAACWVPIAYSAASTWWGCSRGNCGAFVRTDGHEAPADE